MDRSIELRRLGTVLLGTPILILCSSLSAKILADI